MRSLYYICSWKLRFTALSLCFIIIVLLIPFFYLHVTAEFLRQSYYLILLLYSVLYLFRSRCSLASFFFDDLSNIYILKSIPKYSEYLQQSLLSFLLLYSFTVCAQINFLIFILKCYILIFLVPKRREKKIKIILIYNEDKISFQMY